MVPERNASKRLTTPLSPTTRQAALRLGKTGERLGPEILDLEQRADLSPGAVGNDQGARPGQRLQTGGEVWRLADDAPLLRSTRADQIANDDEASGDADPHVQRLLCGEPADRVDDREPGASRALGVVLMRLGIAEIDQHAVAHILGDKTAKAADGVGDAAMVGADDLAQILGIEARRQRRRTDQIAEHHRQLAPLGGVLRLHAGRCGGRRQCLGGGQSGDGSEKPLAVPERHAELLEIDLGQLRQDIGVDFTRAKERLVLSETKTSQPIPDIHGRTPRAPTDHPSVEAPCPGPGCCRTGLGSLGQSG